MTEVTSVNGKTGAVVLAAADVEAIAASQAGAANGVATLGASSLLPAAQLPSSAVTSALKALGNVSGVVKLNLAEATVFTATLTGATEFEITNAPSRPIDITLLVTQDSTGGRSWLVKGLTWIGSESTFLTTKGLTYQLPMLALESGAQLYASAGLVGPEGPRGPEGAASEGVEAQLGIWLPIAFGQTVVPTTTAVSATALRAFFYLIFLPKNAELNVVRVYNGATASANHNAAVYGEAEGGEFPVLWESGSVAASGASEWQTVGEPKLATKVTGRRLYLAIMNSGTTHTFGVRPEAANTGAASLPKLPRLIGAHTFTELKYVKIKEANLEGSSKAICIYGATA